MRLLILAQTDLAPDNRAVAEELVECERTARVAPENRSRLLQVLHLTRALDTGLALIVSARCVPVAPGDDPPRSIGGYLKHVSVKGTPRGAKLSGKERDRYQRTIADVRNRFMHRAGRISEQVGIGNPDR